MDKLRWLKAGWWALAMVGVLVLAVWLAQCPDTAASTGVESNLAPQGSSLEGESKGSPGIPDWDREWQEEQDPSMVGRPTYLR